MRTRLAQVVFAVALLVLSCPRLASRAAAQPANTDILRCAEDVTVKSVIARLYKDDSQSGQDAMRRSLTRDPVSGGGTAFPNKWRNDYVALCVMDELLIEVRGSSTIVRVEVEKPYLIVDIESGSASGKEKLTRYLLSLGHLAALRETPGVVSIETISGGKFRLTDPPPGASMVINLSDPANEETIADEVLDYGMVWAEAAGVKDVWYGERGSERRKQLFALFDPKRRANPRRFAFVVSVDIQWMGNSAPSRKTGDGPVELGNLNYDGGSQRLLLTPQGRVIVEGGKPQDRAPELKEQAPKRIPARPLPAPEAVRSEPR